MFNGIFNIRLFLLSLFCGILKQSDSGRIDREQDKPCKQYTCQYEQWYGIFLQCAGQCGLVNDKKTNDNADGKGEDIHKQDIISQYAGVGVKNHGDGQCTRQYPACQGRADAGKIRMELFLHYKGIEQHGEEYQFHVFPDGFIDRKK